MNSGFKFFAFALLTLGNGLCSAQLDQTYVEKVKPTFVGWWQGKFYGSSGEAFAAYQADLAAGCAATGRECQADSLQPCPASSRMWGTPMDLCWHLRATYNGQVEFDDIRGGVENIQVCPSDYEQVTVLVSGTGTVEDPRYYENFCQKTKTRVLPHDCGCGNPIYPASGTKRQTEVDYAGPTLTFTRTYNSVYGRFRHEYEPDFMPVGVSAGRSTIGGVAIPDPNAPSPEKFPRSFQVIRSAAESSRAYFTGPDGVRDELDLNGTTGGSTAPYLKNRQIRTTINGAPGWLLLRPDEARMLAFDDSGALRYIQSITGTRVTLTYDNGTLISVSDDWGRSLQVMQGADGVAGFVDPAGQHVVYEYSGASKLTNVKYPDDSTRSYAWDESGLSTPAAPKSYNALTGITDEMGQRFASFGYVYGKAVSTEHAGGIDRFSTADTRSAGQGAIMITTPGGTARTTTYGVVGGVSRAVGDTQPAGSGSTVSTRSMGYDANGNINQRDDFNGKRACYVDDLTRNLPTVTVEGLEQTNHCDTVTPALAALPAGSRKNSTQWHPDWNLQVKAAEPGRITTSIYNGQPDPFNGNAIASCAPSTALLADGKPIAVLCKRVQQATTDANGSLGFSAALQSGVPARQSQWTYNQFGQVLTEDGPRTDVSDITTYAYYSDTAFTGADPNAVGHMLGDLKQVTDAAGRVTRYTKYDKHGQVLESVDPNSVITTHSYDPRQRLLSTSVGGRTTHYAYDATGQFKKLTLPDASWIGYEYDNAHRQVAVVDHKGNRIEYVLDNAGKRIGENTKDPSGALKRQWSRSIDALGRVQQTTGRE